MNRRDLLKRAGVLAAAGAAGQPASGQSGRNIVISSANGVQACKKAMQMLEGGADTLDAVVAGVNIVELDPNDHSVGYGGLPNAEGVVELDASVMHGPSRRCGSVAAIHGIKTPSKVAKMVMEQTDHIMLVGDNALKFAKEMGLKEEELLTEDSRVIWMVWKMSLRDKANHSNWGPGVDAPPAERRAELKSLFPHADEKLLAFAQEMALRPTTGTINCLALNGKGEMSGTTTTSGMAWKIPGRVGDSPIIGAGLYVDQDVGAAGSTGRGEENIRIAGAHTIVENLRHGMPPKEACLDALKRVARNFDYDQTRLQAIDIQFYCLRKDGAYAGATLWGAAQGKGAKFALNTGGESRLEPCISLYNHG